VSGPAIARNRARPADVEAHLTACAQSFTPPLGERLAIPDYAAKLVARAERFEAWEGPALIGLVAVYCNDPARIAAFVTNVSVVPARTGIGLGRRLLAAAITYARALGFARMALSVDRGAAAALRLYRSFGFAEDKRDGDTLHLSLALRAQRSGAESASQERDREARP